MEAEGLQPITAEETAYANQELADKAALKIVIQDAALAERYLGTKTLPQEWDRIDDLFRAWIAPRNWPNTTIPRASMGMPLIMEVTETLVPQVHMAFFSDPQPFLLEAKGRTKPAAARATETLLCWAAKEAQFKEEMRRTIKSSILYGIGVGKWGWEKGTTSKKNFTKDDDGNIVREDSQEEVSRPTFEHVEVRNLLVDPATRTHDIRTAKHVIQQMFITAEDLQVLGESGYQNVPSREVLAEIMASGAETATDSLTSTKLQTYRENQADYQTAATSADPLSRPLELLEYWTADRVITVLQRKIVIRNEANEFGRIPFVSCAFIDVPAAFYGFGVGKLLEGEQRFETGVVNAYIDALSLYLNPVWHRKKGLSPLTQNIVYAPGKVVNDDGELTPMEKESLSAEALQAIEVSENRAHRRVGANIGPEMPTQAMRTAEGVNAFTSGLAIRLQYFVDQFAELVFLPVLDQFIELLKDNLTSQQVNAILSDAQGKAYEDGDVLDIYNGTYSVDVLSSTKLAGRKSMIGLVPQLLQLLAAAPVQQSLAAQGKKVDFGELVEQVFDLAGWDADSFITDLTPQDLQMSMAQNPAVIKAKAEQAKLQQQHQNDLGLEEAKTDGRAGVQVVRSILKQHEAPPPALAEDLTAPLAQQPQAEGPAPVPGQ